MIDCINNSRPAQATITYKDGSTELVNNVVKALFNDNSYILQCTSEEVILNLSNVIKIEMK